LSRQSVPWFSVGLTSCWTDFLLDECLLVASDTPSDRPVSRLNCARSSWFEGYKPVVIVQQEDRPKRKEEDSGTGNRRRGRWGWSDRWVGFSVRVRTHVVVHGTTSSAELVIVRKGLARIPFDGSSSGDPRPPQRAGLRDLVRRDTLPVPASESIRFHCSQPLPQSVDGEKPPRPDSGFDPDAL